MIPIITPDGLIFDMPESDRLPKARILDVFPAIRAERATGSNCQQDNTSTGTDSRLVMETRELLDDNTGANPRQIGLARPNFLLRLAGEPLDEFSTLKRKIFAPGVAVGL